MVQVSAATLATTRAAPVRIVEEAEVVLLVVETEVTGVQVDRPIMQDDLLRLPLLAVAVHPCHSKEDPDEGLKQSLWWKSLQSRS